MLTCSSPHLPDYFQMSLISTTPLQANAPSTQTSPKCPTLIQSTPPGCLAHLLCFLLFVFSHLSTSHIDSQLSIRQLLQGRNHFYPCNKMPGPLHIFQYWLNDQLMLETRDIWGTRDCDQDGRMPLQPTWTACSYTILELLTQPDPLC